MYYSDFAEKEKYFSQSDYIDTIEDLQNLLNSHTKKREFFFRGVNEAKYKLYTSAQRKWLMENVKNHSTGMSYNDFVKCLIGRFYNTREKLMSRYFTSLGLPNKGKNMNALCYMQHYGAPTPLLDFTTRINVALFFAIKGAEYNRLKSIDGYFSLYMIKKASESITYFDYKEDGYSLVADDKKLYLINTPTRRYLGKVPHIINLAPNNLNMIAQSGVLLMNYNEFEPIETLSNLQCVNIHKSLIPYIHTYLQRKRIKERYLFPDPEDVVRDCIDSIYEKGLSGI